MSTGVFGATKSPRCGYCIGTFAGAYYMQTYVPIGSFATGVK